MEFYHVENMIFKFSKKLYFVCYLLVDFVTMSNEVNLINASSYYALNRKPQRLQRFNDFPTVII